MADTDNGSRPVWAPWRIEYILAPKDGECFVCEKAAAPSADSANHVVARGESAFVLLNTYPYNPGHLLVTPYRHVNDLDSLSSAERAEIFDLIVTCKQVLTRVMQPDGFNLGCNLGAAAGAGLKDHVHWHVVPRWAGDSNFMPVIGDVRCVPQALAETSKLLRESWT